MLPPENQANYAVCRFFRKGKTTYKYLDCLFEMRDAILKVTPESVSRHPFYSAFSSLSEGKESCKLHKSIVKMLPYQRESSSW